MIRTATWIAMVAIAMIVAGNASAQDACGDGSCWDDFSMCEGYGCDPTDGSWTWFSTKAVNEPIAVNLDYDYQSWEAGQNGSCNVNFAFTYHSDMVDFVKIEHTYLPPGIEQRLSCNDSALLWESTWYRDRIVVCEWEGVTYTQLQVWQDYPELRAWFRAKAEGTAYLIGEAYWTTIDEGWGCTTDLFQNLAAPLMQPSAAITIVPEPTQAAMLIVGIPVVVGMARRRARR